MPSSVPIIDLAPWLGGDDRARAAAAAEGTATRPDLKESFAIGADLPTGHREVDEFWFPPSVYPVEVPPGPPKDYGPVLYAQFVKKGQYDLHPACGLGRPADRL